jgi:hypothetical protein
MAANQFRLAVHSVLDSFIVIATGFATLAIRAPDRHSLPDRRHTPDNELSAFAIFSPPHAAVLDISGIAQFSPAAPVAGISLLEIVIHFKIGKSIASASLGISQNAILDPRHIIGRGARGIMAGLRVGPPGMGLAS